MHIRRVVAEHINSYARAHQAGQILEADKHLRWVCSGLGRILGKLLESEPNCGEYRWVDDILPQSATLDSSGVFALRGILIWGVTKGTTQQWVEPVEVSITLSRSGRGIARVDANVADAEYEIGTVTYKRRDEISSRQPTRRWTFHFSG